MDMLELVELETTLCRMKNRTAPSLDGISSEFLKYGGILHRFRLLYLYNMRRHVSNMP